MPDELVSITFKSNGEEWTATCGEKLWGLARTTHINKQGVGVEKTRKINDDSVVNSIRDNGNNSYVVTLESPGARWTSPFLVGRHDVISYRE